MLVRSQLFKPRLHDLTNTFNISPSATTTDDFAPFDCEVELSVKVLHPIYSTISAREAPVYPIGCNIHFLQASFELSLAVEAPGGLPLEPMVRKRRRVTQNLRLRPLNVITFIQFITHWLEKNNGSIQSAYCVCCVGGRNERFCDS